jgi:beta-phosphoglucomutase-like phosphatase (HAD superfamily)
MSLTPDRCQVIEDGAAGITAAKRAGMKAIWVTKTFGLLLAKPPKNAIFSDFKGL